MTTLLSTHLDRLNAARSDIGQRDKALNDLLADFPDFGDFSSHYQSGCDIDARADRMARLRTFRPYCWQCIRLVAQFKITHDGYPICTDCEIRDLQNMAPQEPQKYGEFTQIALADILRRSGNTLKAEIYEHRAFRGVV